MLAKVNSRDVNIDRNALNETISKKLKKWQKSKVDTIIGNLMKPYMDIFTQEQLVTLWLNKQLINVEDFKLFYVLQNNNTQLKCLDQLKAFKMFSNFIMETK